MAQEIYHRSNWGNPTETWGNTYLNADLTNELYKRASEYENSWVTDQLLNGVGTKPSIILTPTAYEDGVLNSVKPAKTLGSELVTNGTFDTDSNWAKGTGWSIANGTASYDGSGTGYQYILQSITTTSGSIYKINFDVLSSTGSNLNIVDFGSVRVNQSHLTEGNYTFYAQADSLSENIIIYANGTDTFSIDNVSVKEITEADFDFTRGSSATRVNEKGLVQDVQLLSGELVQNGDFEQIGSELVTNGSFDDASGWSFYNEDADTNTRFENNSAILEVINAQFTRFISTTSPMTIGKFYKVTYEVTETDDTDLNIQYPNTSLNSSLGTHTVYIKATNVNIGFSKVGVGKITIDNVSVKEVGQNWTFGTGWSIEDGVAVSDGSQTGNSSIQQSGIAQVGNIYKITFDLVVSSGFINYVNLGGWIDGINLTTSGTYTYYTDTTTATDNLGIAANADFIGSIDNISVIEITDDTDLPRINYTDGEGSLLLEPQSTNLVTNSNAFTTWNKEATVTLTANYGISPDGTQNSTRMQMNANDSIYISKTSGLTASVYVKGTEGETIRLSNGSALIHTLSGQWDRIQVYDSGSTSSLISINTYSGATARDIEIFGAQVEALSYATSYIPTNGSTVTRLADACNNSGNSDLINSTEGVLYAEIMKVQEEPDTFRLLSLNNSASNSDANSVTLGFNNNTDDFYIRIKANNVNILVNSSINSNANQFYKIAVKYKSGDCALWINGVEQDTSTTTFTFAQTLDNLSFDYNGNGILPFYGNVKCVAVFKEALSDTELQKLTTI